MTATAASSPCIPTSCSASATSISRKCSTTTRSGRATRSTPISPPTTGPSWSSATRSACKDERGEPFPQDPHEQLWGAIGAVFGSWMNQRANHLSPPAQHSGKLGHRGQRAGHGVRQYGRDLGHRRRLHAQSVDRREEALRRIPHQRAGRGRGRRHPHAAGDHRGGAHRGRLRQAVDGEDAAQGLCRARRASTTCSSGTTATCRTSNSRSSRASCGCCRPAPASAPPRPRCASRSSSPTKA